MEDKEHRFAIKLIDKDKEEVSPEIICLVTENELILEAKQPIKIAMAKIADCAVEIGQITEYETTPEGAKLTSTVRLTYFDDQNQKQRLSLEMPASAAGILSNEIRTRSPIAQKEVWESLPIELRTAGFGIRFVASLIDGTILGVVSFIFGFILTFGGAQAVATWLGYIIGAIYHIGFWTWRGQTPGKMITGIKIVKTDESPIDFGRALVRYIAYYVSGILLLIGFLWILWDRRKQGLHDKIAGTVVITLRPKG